MSIMKKQFQAKKDIIPARSAHSWSCKRSVAISEVVRRCLNTSKELDWETYFVPILNDYAHRLAKAGYDQKFRKDVLTNGINIYEKKVQESEAGLNPLNRPKDFKKIERRKAKKMKKNQWSKKGGYAAPVIVPSTPGGQLAKMLKEVANEEKDMGIKLKIVEKGGITLERTLMRSNPMASDECGKDDCPVCKKGGRGKICHKGNINYEDKCNLCGEADAKYFGESARNLYTRAKEHEKKFMRQDENSFMFKHQTEYHNNQPPDWSFKVIKSFKDPLSRQVGEAMLIKNHQGILLNSKAEFHQAPLVRVRQEIVRGLDE